MIQRRAADLKMKIKIGCHTFQATGITAYLENAGTLEKAQLMAAHESPRTTKLYDRKFSLSLHPDKTRLIEFGRHAAARRKRQGLEGVPSVAAASVGAAPHAATRRRRRAACPSGACAGGPC
jgi:hypothetical protein